MERRPADGTARADRLSRYKDVLGLLEGDQEQAPDGFATRVMAALPDRTGSSWGKRFRFLWPERHLWIFPALTGAVAMLLVMLGIRLIEEAKGPGLMQFTFELYAPRAKRVEVVGTFSDWMPGEIVLSGPNAIGYWRRDVMLPPGRYEYLYTVDGEKRVLDHRAGLHRPDGFGQRNSVLVIRPEMAQYTQGYPPDEYDVVILTEIGRAISLPQEAGEQWAAILRDGTQAGVNSDKLEHVLARMASAGISPPQARTLLDPVFQGARSGMLVEHLILKLHEGMLKGVSLDHIALVIKKRDLCLKKAGQLLSEAGLGYAIERVPELHVSIAFALESGQHHSYLSEVLTAGKGKDLGQLNAVIEAGETLHHAGLEHEPLKLIIKDCLEKDLEWPEVNKVVRHVKEGLKDGLDGKAIRARLWI
ncbi:MAG: glycogen-binding domain-containing protein [Pseudomonadota bacterium]